MKRQKRHRVVFWLVRLLLTPFIRLKFNYRFTRAGLKHQPAIILPNHVTFWDPLIIGISLSVPMYFVSSDHLFRLGFISRVIQYLVDPIPRTKSDTDRKTVVAMFRKLRAGENICIYPEGKMTWTGETDVFHPTTARLIKRSGVALITFRKVGGYLTQPRWGKYIRRGSMKGSIVNEYSPADLADMSIGQIQKIIEEDLYENAYETQREDLRPYRGKKLAENLELALYICPSCNGLSTLRSSDDLFYCNCGYKVTYNQYGFFETQGGDKPLFDNILDWSNWQSEQVLELSQQYKDKSRDMVIFSDEMQSLWKIERAKRSNLLGKGTMLLYNDRLVFKTSDHYHTFPLDKISDLDIHGRTTIIFTTGTNENYEIKSKHPRSALKYQEFYNKLKTNK
ncbi:MAG TPA: lysophospholipid acyltransferase family protein [Bacillota bacterium]|nr:lysophospholipid acyltransferase family protein [Bacillota bacterium]